MDYDHPVRFGIFPTPRTDSAEETLQMARVADSAGNVSAWEKIRFPRQRD